MPPEEATILGSGAPEPAAAPAAAPAIPAIEQPTLLTPTGPLPLEVPAEPAAPAAEPAKPIDAEVPKAPSDGAKEPSLLEAATPDKPADKAVEKAGEKPGDKPDDKAADKAAEKAGEAPKAEPRVYADFTLPEGITADAKALDAFKEVAGKRGLDQEGAQELLDLHTSTLKQYAEHLRADQIRVFNETTQGWRRNTMADEELGGAGHKTALAAAGRMRDLLVGENHREAFAKFLADTGVGDHPEMIRIFYNAARLFDEPAAPPIPARPIPDRGNPRPDKRATMYDHPSSRKVAGR